MSCPQFSYNGTSTTTQLLMAGQSGTPLSAGPAPAGSGTGAGSGGGGGQPCCESGRPVLTDPLTGQTVCSCQYDAQILGYQRLAASGLPLNVYGTAAAAAAAAAAYGSEQGFLPLSAEQSAFYSPTANGFDLKDNLDAWRSLPYAASMYYPYDSAALAGYPFPNGYGVDLNGARRKNATRETTSTLKAWLNEHRKNPYPTKGEKIMLAIITKMTLTQVSTWFANARRRLKKENKMTWEPRNKMDADDVKDFDTDDDADDEAGDAKRNDRNDRTDGESRISKCKSEDSDDRRTTSCDDSIDGGVHFSTGGGQIAGRPYPLLPPHQRHKLSSTSADNIGARDNATLLPTSEFTATDSSSSPNLPDIQALMRSSPVSGKDRTSMDPLKNSSSPGSTVDPADSSGSNKPKIWSLADTATSKSPPPPLLGGPHQDPMVDMLGHCGWFSVNPYQVSNPSLGAYHPHASGSFATPGSSSHGFVPPQTDTPPQTPPNMKVSSTLSSNGYLGGQSSHLYQSATVGSVSASLQGSKLNGAYSSASNNGRTYRPETIPEDYSATGHYKTSPLQ